MVHEQTPQPRFAGELGERGKEGEYGRDAERNDTHSDVL